MRGFLSCPRSKIYYTMIEYDKLIMWYVWKKSHKERKHYPTRDSKSYTPRELSFYHLKRPFMVTFSLQRFTKWHWRENIGIGETKRKKKKKRGYGFWVTINDEKKKIPLVGSDMSVGPRRAMDDNLVLLLLLNIFCIKSPTPFGILLNEKIY